MDILGDTRIDFIGKRKYTFVLSAVLALIGMTAIVGIIIDRANLGIDFTGGVSVHLSFERPVEIEKARKILASKGFDEADLQEFAAGNKLLIRLKGSDIKGISEGIVSAFKEGFPDNPIVVEGVTEIGPTVGKRLQRDAIFAITIALIGILLYIAWRFEFRFGVAAVIATFHDVLAVLGIFYLLDKEINLLIVTAFLTLAGYSLTDTVVVFDRIRENLRANRKDDLITVINRSINEVLRRTIVTSLTTLLVLIALLLFGGEVIHDFSLALFFGVIVGTYSSVFLASPILAVWKGRGRLVR